MTSPADPLDVLDAEARAGLSRQAHPDWVEPMKAVLTDTPFSDPAWVFEPKYDGYRVLLDRDGDAVRVRSRNRKDLSGAFPELVDAVRAQRVTDVVLDCEVVAFADGRPSFSRLQGRAGLRDPRRALASGIAIQAYVFDVLHLDGHDLTGLPLRDRKRVLADAVDFRDPLRFASHRDTDGEALFREACAQGWEGLVAKRADAPYRGGRSRDWRKLKCTREQEFVVAGFTAPQGGRSGFGSLLVGHWEGVGDDRVLRFAGRVGTGFDEATLVGMRAQLERIEVADMPFGPDEDGLPRDARWVQPLVVVQVAYGEWTDGGRLRHPRFVGLRLDTDPATVERERPG